MFHKADRKKAKLRLALCGVAGSGKTYSALKLATGLVGPNGKIALLDTERGSGELYSKDFSYDVSSLNENFSPENYIKIIGHAEECGYDVLIIDSLSHAWMGEGGVLEMADKATKALKSQNSFAAWRYVTPQHNRLVDTILKSSMHIIVTMRSKTDYVMSESEGSNGKKYIQPQKIGLAPVQKEGLDFEFTVVLDLSIDGNIATSSKDRTKLFTGKHIVIDESTGKGLADWLEDGKEDTEEFDLTEEFKVQLEMCMNIIDLKNTFSKAWAAIKNENYRKELTKVKDDIKCRIEKTEKEEFFNEL